MDAARVRTVEALRERIGRLGGLPGRGTAAPRSSARPQPPDRDAVAPRQPGFVAEGVGEGTAWVRRVSIELRPFLERAGAAGPVAAAELLDLAYPGADLGRAGSTWDEVDVAVVDIESLGLRGSGVVAFLVGIGVPTGTRLHVDQLLLADPGEEGALLDAVLARLEARRLLVSYNGRAFDLPVLRSRCIVNRRPAASLEGRLHCDVLGPVRRLFRDRLGACTLRQAELSLLGLVREGDVPGAEAPGRYRAWLRGAGPEELEGVVVHNQLDLCATIVLAARLAAHVAGRLVEPAHPADRYQLAAHLERRGVAEGIDDHYRAAYSARRSPWDRRAGHRLATRLQRRGGEAVGEAIAICSDLWDRDRLDLRAARSLAVGLERSGRLPDALAVCAGALEVCGGTAPWRLALLRGAPREGWEEEWTRRQRRLARRIGGLRSMPLGSTAQRPPALVPEGAGAVVCPPLLAY